MWLYLLVSAFTIWMIIDAARRRVEYYWFLIIILLAPLGGVIYFFFVRLRALEGTQKNAPQQLVQHTHSADGSSLAQLRLAALESPSIANRLAYAEALRQARDFEAAAGEYEFVLHRDKKCREALHGIALSMLEMNRCSEAVDYLSQLMDIDPRYRDYTAAVDYAEALWLNDQKDQSLQVFEDIAHTSTRLRHHLVLANYLALAQNTEQAKQVLQTAINDYKQSPPFIQRRDLQDLKDAQLLLEQLV